MPEQRDPDRAASRAAARARIEQQQTWVDVQVRQAMERGEFENLPGYGKPIEDLGTEHDPDWWVKRLVEREQMLAAFHGRPREALRQRQDPSGERQPANEANRGRAIPAGELHRLFVDVGLGRRLEQMLELADTAGRGEA